MSFSFGSTSNAALSTGFGTATSSTGFGAPSTGFGAPSTGFGAPATGFGATSSGAPATGFGTSAPATGFGTSAPATGFGTSNSGFGATSSGGFGTTPGFGATSSAGFGSSLGSTAPKTGFGGTSNSTFGSSSTAPSFGTQINTQGSSFGTQPAMGGFLASKPSGLSFGGGLSTGGFGNSLGQTNNEQQKKQREQQVYQLLCEISKDAESSTIRKGYEAKNIWQALALLKSYYDPKSPHCRFRHYFYNIVSPHEVQLYQMPKDHDQKEWDAAQKENPDPTKLVPALAIGFDDVQKRMDQQSRLSEAHNAKLVELEQILNKIKQVHLVRTTARLNESKQKHMETTQRLIRFMRYDQVLRSKGLSITSEEEAMRTRLENVQNQLQKSDLFHGKMNQLWAQLQLIKESGRKYGKIDQVEWHAVSEQHMKEITKNLGEQNKGIHHIIQVINTDSSDIETASKGYKLIQ